jgi:hypothetical protein
MVMPRRPTDPIDMTEMKVLSADNKVRFPFITHLPVLQYFVCQRGGVRVSLVRQPRWRAGVPLVVPM